MNEITVDRELLETLRSQLSELHTYQSIAGHAALAEITANLRVELDGVLEDRRAASFKEGIEQGMKHNFHWEG